MDHLDELADAVIAIKSDKDLKSAFIKILEVGSYSQQVRVEKILNELQPMQPPPEVLRLLRLLKDDKIANLLYSELIK